MTSSSVSRNLNKKVEVSSSKEHRIIDIRYHCNTTLYARFTNEDYNLSTLIQKKKTSVIWVQLTLLEALPAYQKSIDSIPAFHRETIENSVE